MRHMHAGVLSLTLVFGIVSSVMYYSYYSSSTFAQESSSEIPPWVKNNAGWWSEGQIDDSTFVKGIQFLIKEEIIEVPSAIQGEGTSSNEIPPWVKNNAGWWAEDEIDDKMFVQGIQFLIKDKILNVNSNDTIFDDIGSDTDEFINNRDLCPLQPETYNNFQDDDGCPNLLEGEQSKIIIRNAEIQIIDNAKVLVVVVENISTEKIKLVKATVHTNLQTSNLRHIALPIDLELQPGHTRFYSLPLISMNSENPISDLKVHNIINFTLDYKEPNQNLQQIPGQINPPTMIPEQFLIVLEENSVPLSIFTQSKEWEILHVYDTLNGFAVKASPDIILQLRNDSNIKIIEPDLLANYFMQSIPTGINRINADSNPAIDIDGNDNRIDVDIAIIDTGVDSNHPDLNVVRFENFAIHSTDRDNDGHGTSVAGVAAALDNDIGVVGVTPGAKIWALKAGDIRFTPLSNIVEAVRFVTDNASEIEVVNISLGVMSSSTLDDAIRLSVDAGVVYVVSAGNSRMDASGVSPANHPDVITVSAISDSDGEPGARGSGPDDSFASFSNFGIVVDIAAPGDNIKSTDKNGGYSISSGTSIASPHVAGLAALYVAQNGRDLNHDGRLNGYDVELIKDALISGGTPQSDPNGFSGDPDFFSEPLANALGPGLVPPPPPPSTPPDSDNDSIPDNADACPNDAETLNGFQDNDGCPDTLPVRVDLVTANDFGTVSVLLNDGNGGFTSKENIENALTRPKSVILADFGNDGNQDIAVVSDDADDNGLGGVTSIFPGNGDGTFGTPIKSRIGTSPQSIAVTDFNSDGKLDLVAIYHEQVIGTVAIRLGNGDGTFQPMPDVETGDDLNLDGIRTRSWSVAVGDVNNDNNVDFATANYQASNEGTVAIRLGNGDGTFTAGDTISVGQSPQSVKLSDFNNDGNLDIVVLNYYDRTISILLGNGNGTFGPKTDFSVGNNPVSTAGVPLPQSVSIEDFNNDGNQDVAIVHYNDNAVGVLLGNGNGTFGSETTYLVGDRPTSIDIGDFDGDSNQDLAVTNTGNDRTISILLGNGNGTFGPKTDFSVGPTSTPMSIAVGYLD